MNKLLTATLAALGLIVSSALGALVVAGILEGIGSAPGWLPETAAIAFFTAGMALTGQVCVDVAGRHALLAIVTVSTVIGIAGWLTSRVTEAHGEGLDPNTVLISAAGLATLLAASVTGAHRRNRHRTGSAS